MNDKQKNSLRYGFIKKIPIAVYSICIYFRLFREYDIAFVVDEIGNLALPGFLAGKDWSSVISLTKYYGYGYKWFYFIFFKITDNPLILYKLIAASYLIFFVLIASLCLHIFNPEDNIKLSFILILIMLIFPISIGNRGMLDSEYSIYFAMVILVYLIKKITYCNHIRERRLWSAIIGVYLCYMCTLHERCVAVLISFIVIVLLDWIYTKKPLVSIPFFGVSVGIAYVLQEFLTNYLIKILWNSTSGNLGNTSVIPSNPLFFLENKEAFQLFMNCIFSNIVVVGVNTLGIFVFFILLSIVGITDFFKKEKKYLAFYEENRFLFLTIFQSFLIAIICILGTACRWGESAYAGDLIGYKGFCYKRYSIVFVYVGCMALVVIFNQIKKYCVYDVKRIHRDAIFILILFMNYLWAYVVPTVEDANIKCGGNLYIERMGFLYDIFSDDLYCNVLISCLVAAFFLIFCLNKNKSVSTFSIIFITIFICYDLTLGFTGGSMKINYFCDDTYKLIDSIEKSVAMPHKLYLCNTSKNRLYIMQFVFSNYSIDFYDNIENESNDIIALARNDKAGKELSLSEKGYICYQLDEDEYLWVKGLALNNAIEEYLQDKHVIDN